jgi:hypothetical protein
MVKVVYKLNGKSVSRKAFNKRPLSPFGLPAIMGAYSEANPLVSIGCGCHPSQVQEFNAAVERSGIVGVRHRRDGAVEFTSRGGRRKWLKFRGFQDNDGGYGDG